MGIIKSQNAPASLTPFSMADIEAAAKRILIRAQQQAEQLITAAQVESRTMREQAFADGFIEGRKAGLAKGQAVAIGGNPVQLVRGEGAFPGGEAALAFCAHGPR